MHRLLQGVAVLWSEKLVAASLSQDGVRLQHHPPHRQRLPLSGQRIPASEGMPGDGYIGRYAKRRSWKKSTVFQIDRDKFDSVSGHHFLTIRFQCRPVWPG